VTTRPHDIIVDRSRGVLQEHDEDVKPCLVHRDLWSGNAGLSCAWDLACYYGDPEVDVATSEMFGGFGSQFYDEYEAARGIAGGYQDRKMVYNLFHVLNHARLFGGAFITEAGEQIEALFR
jgi:fructosamine-3-kinase